MRNGDVQGQGKKEGYGRLINDGSGTGLGSDRHCAFIFYTDVCARGSRIEAQGYVCRYVFRHVCRHAFRQVSGHLHRHVHRHMYHLMCIDMCVDM